jgi:hypothetical protein
MISASNVRWGLKGGVGLALIYCAWATFVRLAGGSAAFDRDGVSYTQVTVGYLAAGVLAGAAVGALRPLAQTRLGAYMLGVLAGTILSASITLTIAGLPSQWDFDEWVLLPVIAIGAGLAFGRELYSDGGRAGS